MPNGSTHSGAAIEGNDLLMTAMIATRPVHNHSRADNVGERGRVWLDSLFAGEFSFPAIHTCALSHTDRSAAEHDAVSRAAGCRDLFVIHADTTTGERVIADLARSVAERVLILSPNPAAADRITERLLKCGVAVVRALADDENPVRPSSAVSKVTSAAIGHACTDNARKEAAAAVVAAEQRVAAFGVVSKAIARLREVNDELNKFDASIAEQTARRNRIEADVRSETNSPFGAMLAKLKSDHDDTTARLTTELQTIIASRMESESSLAEARQHHADAIRKPGLLSRLFGGSKPKAGVSDAAELEKQVHTLEAEVAALATRATELRAKLEHDAATYAADRDKRIVAEITIRRTTLDSGIAATESDRTRTQAEAAALNKVIGAAVPGEDHAAAERQLAAARQRAAEVAAAARELIARAIAEQRVVVGIPKSLEADAAFSAVSDDPPFDLLILDRAEELPEAEFPRLAHFAERWVLVGEVHDETRAPNSRASRNGRAIEVPFVARLARLLDRETWAIEGDRLVCRLTPLTQEQRRTVTREPLADRPEIELRFTASESDPLLAEIAFPATTGVPSAKSFLFHTLGEVLLRPCGELCWRYEADAIIATWPATDNSTSVWIDLEAGVREKVAGAGLFAFTAAIRFELAAGWDAEKAQAWLAECLPDPATGRFAALPRLPGSRG